MPVSKPNFQAGLMSKVFPLIVDEYEPDTFKGVKHRIKQRFDFGENKIVNIKLSDENMVSTYELKIFCAKRSSTDENDT